MSEPRFDSDDERAGYEDWMGGVYNPPCSGWPHEIVPRTESETERRNDYFIGRQTAIDELAYGPDDDSDDE